MPLASMHAAPPPQPARLSARLACREGPRDGQTVHSGGQPSSRRTEAAISAHLRHRDQGQRHGNTDTEASPRARAWRRAEGGRAVRGWGSEEPSDTRRSRTAPPLCSSSPGALVGCSRWGPGRRGGELSVARRGGREGYGKKIRLQGYTAARAGSRRSWW